MRAETYHTHPWPSRPVQYPHVTLSGSKFTIGRHWRCNLQLLDPNISRLFCRLVYEVGASCLCMLLRYLRVVILGLL